MLSVLIISNMSKKEQALQMAKNASIELLEETRSLHEVFETCKDICKLVEISEENTWLDLEINGYLVKYKTRDEICQNLPSYRKTSWKFYDIYGNLITLPPDIMDLFGKSFVYHPVRELENKDQIIIGVQFLDKFNKFILEHGMDQVSKSLRIHEARISKDEIKQVLEGVKKRIQELLDVIISLLEME
jgi:AbiTii